MGFRTFLFGFLLFFQADSIVTDDGTQFWIVKLFTGRMIVERAFRVLFGHVTSFMIVYPMTGIYPNSVMLSTCFPL